MPSHRAEQLAAAVAQMPPGPSRERFTAVLAELRAADESSPSGADGHTGVDPLELAGGSAPAVADWHRDADAAAEAGDGSPDNGKDHEVTAAIDGAASGDRAGGADGGQHLPPPATSVSPGAGAAPQADTSKRRWRRKT